LLQAIASGIYAAVSQLGEFYLVAFDPVQGIAVAA